MNRIKSDSEYEDVMAKLDAMLEKQPHPDSPEGHEVSKLIALTEEYEDRTAPPRIESWVCVKCNRSLNPEVEVCRACEETHPHQSDEERAQKHINDRFDHMIQCDANFRGRGC